MRCPQCAGQHLKIAVRFEGFVTALFHDAEKFELTEPVSMMSVWNDDSPCHCKACGWKGIVGSCQQVLVDVQ